MNVIFPYHNKGFKPYHQLRVGLACSISPIVQKLPCNLQDKWISQGSKYKEEYHISYHPVSFLTQFICLVALLGCSVPAAVSRLPATHTQQQQCNRGQTPNTLENVRMWMRVWFPNEPTKEEAICLIKGTQTSLAESYLSLKNIVSNSMNILRAFPAEDHMQDIKCPSLSVH